MPEKRAGGRPARMKLVGSREVYRCDLFWVSEDHARDNTGFEMKRSVVQHRGSAVIFAANDAGNLLLIRQYRLPLRAEQWELPAGKVDEGESPLQAAKREFKEETGYRARHWRRLGSFVPSPGYAAEKMTIYLATQLAQGEATPMEDERIETRWFPATKIEKMILNGKIIDAKTIIGYFLWKVGHDKRSWRK